MSSYRDSRDNPIGIARPTGHYHLSGSSPIRGCPGEWWCPGSIGTNRQVPERSHTKGKLRS